MAQNNRTNLKILITNWRLTPNGGTETWTHTMREALESLGHQVTLADKPLKEHFDLALINHLDPKDIKADRKIYTSHGIIPKLERPKTGADVYVAVSEEARNFHRADYVIRNPIATDTFKPTTPINKELANILVMTNNPINKDKIKRELQQYNLTFIGGENRVSNTEDYINQNDLVISLGRGAYESAACNRNVLVYDYRGGDGMLTPETYYQYRQSNCSGRYNNLQDIEIKYNPKLKMRQIIKREHNPIKIAKEYLKLGIDKA